MTTYASVDDVPDWDALTNVDALLIAEGGMIAGILRLVPAIGGNVNLMSAIGGNVNLMPALVGDVDLRAA